MSEYAIIGKVKVSPIPGAKTLQQALYNGLTFAVGLDVNEDDLYVIFMPDGKLGEEYARINDCIYRGKDEQGNRLGGYFDANRKVRSLKLMGGKVISVGYVAPLDSLKEFGDVSHLREGDVVDTWNGYTIAEKFLVNPNYIRALKVNQPVEVCGFAKHPDTKQFYRHMSTILAGSLITLTEKLHGTSARYAYLPKRSYRWWEKMLNWGKTHLLGMTLNHYQLYCGSRNRVVFENSGSWYGSERLWLEVGNQLEGKLQEGETIFGEIVGWIGDKPIQKAGGVAFTYGVPKGKAEFYVYNITQTLPSGLVFTLPWEAIKARCAELGLETVPELHYAFTYNGDLEALKSLVYYNTDGNSIWGKHIREGVVLRVEHEGQVQFIKNKSNAFYVLEDASKNAGESNLEEEQ